jgi:hypothetical protein
MNHRLFQISVLAVAFLGGSSVAIAHHGYSVYDLKKTTTLNGTITAFDWDNPHCLIHIDVMNNGDVQHWTLELPSPFTMNRKGWAKDSLKPGDQASIETHPARNGATIGITGTSGAIMKVVVNGKTLSE